MHIYFGTYGNTGIHHYAFDIDTGSLTPVSVTDGMQDPNFLTLHPSGKNLYSVIETSGGGAIAAFAIDPDNAHLTLLNTQPTQGTVPCHIAIDQAATTAIVSNYGDGSITTYPLESDGALGPAALFIKHTGDSPTPHAHSVTFDANDQFAIAADLGLDELRVYRFDIATSTLSPHDPPALKMNPGAGPRHFTFDADHRFAYAINELDSTITAMQWDATRGELTTIQNQSTLPKDFNDKNSTAEIAIHPNGRFLYGSNRGHDSLAIFAINQTTGELTLLGHEPTRGHWPRHFAIDPTGRWLIVCNERSNSVQVFAIDSAQGELSAVGEPIAITAPVYARFMQAR